MEMMLVVFIFMLLVVVLMAVGVLLGRKPISGSCGGMSAIGMESACDVCGGDKQKCDTEKKKVAGNVSADLGYDASQK
ncbi:(Na+)-NQR maturation NqrM [Bermanella sp. WJH001]|uniref:(Na+)-NQR maturation NqrM n=1 Tax=Bermanella sp. WJH001 TaxID=3048005 RepID=UPI0024BD805D|nr:(Na+)-NQR maturation NqrM [Bermanella sp. WJH001]MDJ1537214.1 (Na+)-NQR maturation NqrM [Bermanella sp. WJH001]